MLYEMMDYSLTTETLNVVADFDFYSFNLESTNRWINVYFIVEFNPSADINAPDFYDGDEFIMNTFDIRLKDIESPHTILFSSTVDDRFFLTAQGIGGSKTSGQYGNVFRTMDNGINYLELTNTNPLLSNILGGFGSAKRLFLASPNDPYTYYMGATGHYPIKSVGNLAGVQSWTSINAGGQNGVHSHDDYRSGKIYNIGGEDYIVAGNDGGICETVTGQFGQTLNSLNGDVSLNMIYSLDVHEKTETVLIGLQDNGTRYFQKGIDDVQPTNLNATQGWGGDGCITLMKRETGDLGAHAAVAGDPQHSGSTALKDIQYGNWPTPPTSIVNSSPPIDGGEPYLGMRLEEYKSYEDRFITGLQGGHLIMNRGANQGVIETEKVEVPGAGKIGAIAICQNSSLVAYVADGNPRYSGETKLYRSVDDGHVWPPINADLHFPDHPTQPNLILNLTDDIEGKFINALGVDHDNPNLVYIGMSGIGEINQVVTNEYFRVLRSFDGGFNFNDWSHGLPALPINYLLPIESENHIIFCATDAGVYYRMDGMAQWECFSNHLAKTRITDLSYNYCSRELYASTYGRGVWKTPVNLETQSAYSEDIVGNEVWSVDRDVRSNIRVKSGSTLTITSTIHIDADRKFIVEPGAKLIIDNGTLTNACAQYWTGIEVWGDESFSQDPQNQGHLITRNNSKIEYAKEAISVWKLGDYGSTGGIVHAQNTDFVNNRTSAYFYPYHDINGSIETLNVGFMTNCQFLWDDNYIDENPDAGVIMYNVNGVTISGCDFMDSRASLVQTDSRPKGVFSLDAGYRVIARPTVLTPLPVHEVFATTGGYDVNNFINLDYGIHALGANTIGTITADHCKFEDVRHSISISAVNDAVLTRNLVNYTTAHPADIASSQGFGISESKEFMIEGNTFNNADPSAFSSGVLAWDTGAEDNRIYLNYYNDQNLANYAYGNNSNTDPTVVANGNFQGLTWECNEGINNRFDLASFAQVGIDGQGVKLHQGDLSISTGNKFTDVSYSSLSAHVLHTDDDQMEYFYDNGLDKEPIVLDGDITTIVSNDPNECLSNFLDEIVVQESSLLSSSSESQLLTEITQLDQELLIKRTELETNRTNGGNAGLHQLVANLTPNTKQTVYAALLVESPYLSQSLLEELGEITQNSFSDAWYTDLIKANIEVTRSQDFMNFLQTKTVPLPVSLFNQIEELRNSTFTERGILEMTINHLAKERKQKTNLLVVNEMSDPNVIDWNKVKNAIVLRENKACRSEVSDKFLGEGKASECLAMLDSIDQNLADYNLAYEQQEMQDFTAFKRYVLSITNNTGVVEGLNESQIQQLTYMADQFKGRAAIQARNILCFHKGMCEDRVIVLPPSGMQIINPQGSSQVEEVLRVSGVELKVIPNPNKGEFVLEVPKECSIANLSIVDVQGKIVAFETIEQVENKNRIVLMNEETGILFLKAECVDGSIYTTRIVVKK